MGLLHRVEERPGLGDREGRKRVGETRQMAAGDRTLDVERLGRLADDLMERRRPLLVAVDFARRVGDRVDLAPERLLLALGDVELLDRRRQQVADVMNGVRDRRVRADERAFHAAGAEVRDELRHGAAEQALVLEGGAAGRDEQTRARQDRRLGDRSVAEGRAHDLVEILGVEEARRRRRAAGAAHRRRERDREVALVRGRLFSLDEFRLIVVEPAGRLQAVADHRHVAFDDRAALGAELLGDLRADLVQDRLFRRALGDALETSANGADEGDAHHARLELGGRRVFLGDLEGVDEEDLDLPVADRLARLLRQLLPHRYRIEVRLQDERPAFAEALERVRVAEHLVVGRDDELDVLELGVGDQHRLRAQRDVVVGRRAALLRAVFRRGPRMQVERAGENVGEQLAGGDGAVAADRMEADAERRLRQEDRVRLGLERHQLGVGIGGPAASPAVRRASAADSWRRTASRDRRTARCASPCS